MSNIAPTSGINSFILFGIDIIFSLNPSSIPPKSSSNKKSSILFKDLSDSNKAEILDKINKLPNKRHFCIFDELYSGTNPSDAVDSAYSFLSYLTKFKNINFILTTHYVDLCEKLDLNKTIENKNMKIINNNNDIIYTYKLTKGICKIKGGNKILKDLGYPDEIIKDKGNTLN